MTGPSPLGYAADALNADGSSYELRLLGPIQMLYGGSSFVTSIDIRAIEANLLAKLGWRTFDVHTNLPGAWNVNGTARDDNGSFPESFDMSQQTSSLFVQAGVFTALSTGTAPKNANVRLWSAVKDPGWVVARQRLVLQPSSGNVILPIGRPFPCVGVMGLMFGFMFTGVSGTIASPACVWRSFDSGDPLQPNAWSTALTTLTNVTSNRTENSGNLAITTTDKIMAQAGFKYSTSGTDPNATVDILVAAKL